METTGTVVVGTMGTVVGLAVGRSGLAVGWWPSPAECGSHGGRRWQPGPLHGSGT